MAINLADMRKRSDSDFSKITAALTKKTEYSKDDEGFWKPTQDKAGNATATIRFLPAHPDDELFFVQYYTHSWQQGGKGGKWFIDNCPTSVGRDECPVCKLNKDAYASMTKEAAKKATHGRSRKQVFISNILVVRDPANPDNDGKVFRFKYGKKIKEKIDEKLSPIYDDIKPVRIYDIDQGADFRLIMAIEDSYPSYSKSFFGDVKPISDDDNVIVDVLNQMVSLKPFVTEDKFKSQADLQKRLDFVLGTSTTSTATAEASVRQMVAEVRNEAPKRTKAADEPKAAAPVFEDVPDADDLEQYFADMAK